LKHRIIPLMLGTSGSLITSGTLVWFVYEEVSNVPNKRKWKHLI